MRGQAILIMTAFVALLVLLTIFLVFQQGSLRANVAIREPVYYKIMYIIDSRLKWNASELAEEIIKETYCSAIEVNITIFNLTDNSLVSTDYVSSNLDNIGTDYSLISVDYTRVTYNNTLIIYHIKTYKPIG